MGLLQLLFPPFAPVAWAAARRGLASPVFIVGCGRSGTSILGETLARHAEIVYLNERRDLWTSAYPRTDIWSERAADRGGRIRLGASDVDPARNRRLKRLFRRRLWREGGSLLLEKLPINSFRLEFIAAIFPDARFLHIHRNGVEVAESIARWQKSRDWYGADGYKWRQLQAYAEQQGLAPELVSSCETAYEQGLLEWRLSTEAVIEFLRPAPAERYLEISYASLVDRPVAQLEAILGFLRLSKNHDVIGFAADQIHRRHDAQSPDMIGERELALGGRLLRPSMSGQNDLVDRSPP